MEFNSVGTTGITVSDLCVGTSPLGGMPQTYGYSVEEARAVATVEAVFETAIDFMDTSNEASYTFVTPSACLTRARTPVEVSSNATSSV